MNPNTHAHCACPCMLAAGCAARRQHRAASCGACVVSPCLFDQCDIISSPHGTRALHLPLRACTDLQIPWDAEANATSNSWTLTTIVDVDHRFRAQGLL
eukprot:365197-Chlamydomonas_euryale.AAC.5